VKSRVRVQALVVAAATSGAMLFASPPSAGAATQTCPAPALATVPCVITVQNNTTSPILTATPTRLVSTTVAPGKYAIAASAVVFNSSGPGEPVPSAHCTLKAGGTVLDQFVGYTLDQATTVTLLAAGNFTTATKVSVACSDPTGFASLTADYTRLQATQLATLRQVTGANETPKCPTPKIPSIPCAVQVQTTSPTSVGASLTPVATVNLGAGSYTMIGRVAFSPTSSGSADVQCTADNGVIGLSEGKQFILQGKTAALTLGTSFILGGTQPIEVTCSLLDGSQATVDNVRLTIVRVARLVRATGTTTAKCPVRQKTVPCAITAQGGGSLLTSTHTTYAEAHVAAGDYVVSGAVSLESTEPLAQLHDVDCALVSGPGEFGAAFDVVSSQGGTLFMLDAHTSTKGDLTLSCADDSGGNQFTVSSAEITATRVGTLLASGQ
jgi:hypothetical protein